MNGEVQLIVRTEKLPAIPTQTEALAASIVSGDSFCFASPGQSDSYTVGSKIEIVDDSGTPPYPVLFTRYVTGYNDATGEISVNEPFTSNVSAAGTAIYVYTLTITEGYLDLFENESISQNWKFQDLSNFTAQGAFSREFRIPMSDNNIKAIGPLFDTNSEQGEQNYFFYKLPAEIRVDTLPIASGYLRVRKVYKQMNRINEVEVAFYAETPDLVRTIGEKKLSDIAALADLNEVVNYANVTTETADRIWSLCDRAQKWSNDGTVGSRPIFDENNPVNPADLTPSVSWWFLLRSIVTEAGFDLVASSLENIIEDYYMPFTNTPLIANVEQPNNYFFLGYNTANQVIPLSGFHKYNANAELYDNNSNFNTTTQTYTAPLRGQYTFQVYLKAQTTVNVNLSFYFNVNGTNIFVATRTVFLAMGVNTINFQSVQILDVGDTLELIIRKTGGGGTTTILSSTGGNDESRFELINVNAFNGLTIDYSANAPDMRQIDFVNDVIKMHNCAIVPSRIVPNRIAIVPQNNYLGTGDVVDWTSKLDVSKDVVVSSTVDLQKSKFLFTYTAGEDVYSKLYVDVNRVYGDFKQEGYTINPSTSPSDFAIGDQKITLVTRSTPAALIPNTGIPIPSFYNEQLEYVAPGPRALFNAGIIDVNLYNDATSSAASTTEVPILNHYSNSYPTLTDLDLNWAPEVPPHSVTVISNPYNNLFNSYWRNYMNELYSPEGRMMEAFFALDLKDILTFSFADKIWIQDSYWRILEISDYKVGLQESTKVKLMKYLDQVNDCASTPTGVTINGEVEFESGGEPVESTEDCCSRYGYFWDEINGVCWAFNNGGQFRNTLVANPSNVPTNPELQSLDGILFSVINGQKISLEEGNINTLAVGENLNLTKIVNGSNLLGKNVTTNLPGLHVGGGYRAGNPAAPEIGWAQFGQFSLHRYPTITASGQVVDLFIEGISGEYIEMPDETLWSCVFNVTIRDAAGTSEVSLHHFTLEKVGGVAIASAINTLSTIGSIGAYVFTFGIDTTTNPDEHRINVTVTGGTYPEVFLITTSIQYQQNKIA